MRSALLLSAFVLSGCELLGEVPLCDAPTAKLVSIAGLENVTPVDVDGATWFVVPRASTFTMEIEGEQLDSCLAKLALEADQNVKAEVFLDGPGTIVDSGVDVTVEAKKIGGIVGKAKGLIGSVRVAAGAPVGGFGVRLKFGQKVVELPERLVLTFNAKSTETAESIASLGETALAAYVTGQAALIATSDSNFRGWNFDPFNPSVLKAALTSLGDLSLEERRDPVKVAARVVEGSPLVGPAAREITENSPELMPSSGWVLNHLDTVALGCAAKSGDRVKYGQCWVFSAVTTSLKRSLGLPTRVVTNVSAAHESRTAAVEFTTSATTKGPAKVQPDSPTRNFHVWTEVFAKNGTSSGWHAYDATPQERSDGPMKVETFTHQALVDALGKVSNETTTGYVATIAEALRQPVRSELRTEGSPILLGVESPKFLGFQPSSECKGGSTRGGGIEVPVAPADCNGRTGCETGLGDAGVAVTLSNDADSGKTTFEFKVPAGSQAKLSGIAYSLSIEGANGADAFLAGSSTTFSDDGAGGLVAKGSYSGRYDTAFLGGETDADLRLRAFVFGEGGALVGWVTSRTTPEPLPMTVTGTNENGKYALKVKVGASPEAVKRNFVIADAGSSGTRLYAGGQVLEAAWREVEGGVEATFEGVELRAGEPVIANLKCEDKCLEQVSPSFWCGTTDHL